MAKRKFARRLAAILAADMVGYSRLIRLDEDGTLAALKSLREEVIDPQIAEHNGRIVKLMGDGMLNEFASVVDAVSAGVGIQRAIAARNAGLPEDRKMVFRVGINLGDVVVDGDDIHGDGVNLAARLEGLAKPGGICITAAVHDQVRDRLKLDFEDMGEHMVKNIDRAIHVYRVLIDAPPDAGGPAPAGPARPAVDVGSTIAVLPFDNMGGSGGESGDDDYFADGLTEDIITALSRYRELRVIARNSTFRFKGQAIDIGRVGRELGARYVIEGSVRRAGTRVRITAQLIDVADGTHIWAERYDREMEDIFAVQDEVTRTIAATLGVRLQDKARERAMRKNPVDLNAYDCVLRARRYTTKLTGSEHAAARDLLERAIALDPGYSEAHALLANVYLAEHRFGANPRPDPIGRAMAMVRKAIELDPQNAYAHCWLAIVHFFRHENANFDVAARRALALNPSDPEILAEIGHYCAFIGQYERGIELSGQAMELNPLHPGWYHFALARHHMYQREHEAVLIDVQKIDMPEFYWTHLLEAAALGHLGRAERARAALGRLLALTPGFSAADELHKWNTASDDAAHIVEGLRKAGLEA